MNTTDLVSIGSWLLLSLYVWLLPHLALTHKVSHANVEHYCTTGVTSKCLNSYEETFNVSNQILSCGCGEGIFGHPECLRSSWGFTVSHYISTPTGTILMGILSFVPVLRMWRFSMKIKQNFENCKSDYRVYLLPVSISIFIMTWIIFLFVTVCTHSILHSFFVAMFILAAISTYGTIYSMHITMDREKHELADKMLARYVAQFSLMTVLTICLFLLSAYTYQLGLHDIDHAPWFFECVAISFGFFIPLLDVVTENSARLTDVL